ncbi:hypothetical protein [Shewanella khirikhana]|uniref:Uncharacterized protein n=1 Tax=Shewanella khirikhana TaxID=1965282 RepID=A0ABM7DQ69_9GAMM|nr:hypothetical protein [Shewanella khirikhana]AZQ11831.1 hypothetical protein STH12_02762 [Shewanella khirikhana]
MTVAELQELLANLDPNLELVLMSDSTNKDLPLFSIESVSVHDAIRDKDEMRRPRLTFRKDKWSTPTAVVTITSVF